MDPFTDETRVREAFFLTDSNLVDTAVVDAAIAAAHAELEPLLDPEVDTESPPELLVSGETQLAGAYVLRALATADAVRQKHVAIGGQRIEAGRRFGALRELAADAERCAWALVAPSLAPVPARAPLDANASESVWGGAEPCR